MSWTNALIDVLLVIYVLDCVFMGLVIMMQRSKQEGLGAAFGGGFTESIWGAQTSQVLVKATVVAAALFFFLSICLARLYSNENASVKRGSPVQQELAQPGIPVATNAASSAPVVPTGAALPPTAVTPTSPATTPAGTPAKAPSTTPPAPIAPKSK